MSLMRLLTSLAGGTGQGLPAAAPHVLAVAAASAHQLQSLRSMADGPHHGKEPMASPWIKVLERPGADLRNQSEENSATNPYVNKDAEDVSADVPEKNPDRQPQAPIDPEVQAAASANPSVDSMRYLAGKVNEAVGGSCDFPKTGGASLREMASEIGENIGDKLGVHKESTNEQTTVTSKAEQAAEGVADAAHSTFQQAKETITGNSSDSSNGISRS